MTSNWKPAHSTFFINFEKHFSVDLYCFPKSKIDGMFFVLKFLSFPNHFVWVIIQTLIRNWKSQICDCDSLVNFVLISTLSFLFNSYKLQIDSTGANT